MSENQNRDPQGVPTGGQYAATPRPDADVTLASQQAPLNATDFEDEAYEMLRESLADKLEEPEHYSEDDLAEVQRKIDAIDEHLAARARATRCAGDRLDLAADRYFDAEEEVQEAAVAALREIAANQHPRAAYFTMNDSDQGPYMTGGMLYDAAGEELEEFDDEGRGSWLSNGADLPDHWSQAEIDTDDLTTAGVSEESAGEMTRQPGYDVRVFRVN